MRSILFRALVLVALAQLFAAGSPEDHVTFHVPAGTVLARHFESRKQISQDEVEMLLNGEPLPSGNDNGMALIQSQRLEVVDEFTAVETLRTVSLKRSFEKIASSGEQTTKNPMDAGSQEDTTRSRSELEGKTVVFQWDAAKERYVAHFEPEGPDVKLLSGLDLDLDFLSFLPPAGSVSAGDAWSLDVGAMERLFLPGGNLSLKPEEAPDSAGDGAALSMFKIDPAEAFSGLDGDVEATYKGTREVDGVSCGVIAIEFKVHSARDLSDKLPRTVDDSGASSELEVEHLKAFLALEGGGELIWDLAAGHARSFSLSARIKNQMELLLKVTNNDKTMDILRKMRMSGTYEMSVAISKR